MEQTRRTVSIEVDASRETGMLARNWRYIGYDENNYTHTPEGEALLASFGDMEPAPCFVRAHHMLCTGNLHGVYKWGSTNAYTEDDSGNPIYTWDTVDRILDTLLRSNCKPFFELGFMPFHLVDPKHFEGMWDGQKYDEYKRRFWAYPPKDYEKWQHLISALVSHCVDKYGKAEVLTWYWELWNEPDIFYWQGTPEEFFRLYDHTEYALHAVLPEARLGGPGTTDPNPGSKSLAFLEAFLDHCKGGQHAVTGETGTRLDFITYHTKGGGFPFKIHAKKETPTIGKQVSQVRTGLDAMHRHGYSGLEVVLSEADPDGWAAGGVHDNANMKFRNTEYYASYVACGYHHIEKLARAWNSPVRPLAWAFLFRGERCFEGTRTFSTQGIDKPVLQVFRLFSRLGENTLLLRSSAERFLPTQPPHANPSEDTAPSEPSQQLAGTDDHPADISGTATVTADGHLALLLYSHHDDWDVKEAQRVELSVCALSQLSGWAGCLDGGTVQVTHLRIDGDHSNAHTHWQAMGRPEYPSSEQMASLKAHAEIEALVPEQVVPIANDQVHLTFLMPAHAVSLIELRRLPTSGGAAL